MRRAVQNHAAKDLNESLYIHCGGPQIFVSGMALQPLGNEWKHSNCTTDCIEKAEYFNPEQQSLVIEE
jgi:hypothetical protein